eukprot:scaffold8371_cov199-Amphora_coffeaeformis.AAC.2
MLESLTLRLAYIGRTNSREIRFGSLLEISPNRTTKAHIFILALRSTNPREGVHDSTNHRLCLHLVIHCAHTRSWQGQSC